MVSRLGLAGEIDRTYVSRYEAGALSQYIAKKLPAQKKETPTLIIIGVR